MQQANVMLALGGNLGQTVPKFGVTPAEVAVLREIHGSAAVYDIQPLDEEVDRSSREERSRLLEIYGKPPGSREISAVEFLFPGAAARVYESFDELELDESFYKATGRVKPTKVKAKAKRSEPDEEDEDEDGEEDEDEAVDDSDEFVEGDTGDEPVEEEIASAPQPKAKPRPKLKRKPKSSKPLFLKR